MPIKLPKGFARRRSSGNALEEVENPPQPSFKVYERPGGGSRSFDGPNALKRLSRGRPLSSPENMLEDDDNLFADMGVNPNNNRGSGGTNKSTSTGGLYDSSASSVRFSSSSTLPSSTDVPIHNDPSFSVKRSLHDIPIPPIPESQPAFSLRAGGRTFSFGVKSPKSSPIGSSRPGTGAGSSPTINVVKRERAMTASTASTATPPKLLDSDLNFDSGSGGFGNLFEDFGNKSQTNLSDQGLLDRKSPSPNFGSSPPPPVPPKSYFTDRSHLVPSPISVDRTRPIESSPYSWDSHHSNEILMSSPSPPLDIPVIPRKALPESKSMPIPETSSSTTPIRTKMGGLRRSSAYGGRRRSTPIEDEDARLVQDSVPGERRTFSRPTGPELFDTDDGDIGGTSSWRGGPSEQTPKPKKILPYRDAESPTRLDTSLAANAQLASQYEASSPTKASNKVMTPAQFERYRRQQELTREKSDASRSEGSEDGVDNYDDDDETERNKQAAKQRRKQEAHLAVYRQQMMKVTGEQPSMLPNLGQAQSTSDKASRSTPDLRLSTLSFGTGKPGDTGKTSDDEDDDVPLGILAAHGFPNRNRPPVQLSGPGSVVNVRHSSQPGPPASVMGESTLNGSRGNLPVFARHLPQDPYYGASLVNTSNREGMAMNGGAPQMPAGPPPGVPPGGLVGVIAGEERARAMRRGSPNAQPGHEPPGSMAGMGQVHPGMQRAQTMGNMSSMGPMGMPGMAPMLSPGDQAQMQMSQQMTQMMQMQMQWMQQMMQMQGIPNNQMPPMPQPPMNNFLAPPGQMGRPMSMGANVPPNSLGPRQDQRTLSMLDPSLSRWNRTSTFAPSMSGVPGGQGYAPSIAPSERSNVGMASRYRPVSIAPPVPNSNLSTRASTFTASSAQAWNQRPQQPMQSPNASSTVRAVSPRAEKNGSDDDDDEAWADMKKKRDKKRSTWKMKKGQAALQDIFHVGT